MFQSLQPPPESRAQQASRVSQTLMRSRRVRAGAVALGMVCAMALVAAGYAWRQMISYDCGVEEVDLSVDQLVSLRKRMRAYQLASTPDASMDLSSDELTFFVWNKLDYHARILLEGERVSARVVLPGNNGTCFDVDFRGQVAVRDGVATVAPERLVVGALDLSPLTPRSFEVRPDQLEGDAGSYLANTVRMEVQRGRLVVTLFDRRKVW